MKIPPYTRRWELFVAPIPIIAAVLWWPFVVSDLDPEVVVGIGGILVGAIATAGTIASIAFAREQLISSVPPETPGIEVEGEITVLAQSRLLTFELTIRATVQPSAPVRHLTAMYRVENDVREIKWRAAASFARWVHFRPVTAESVPPQFVRRATFVCDTWTLRRRQFVLDLGFVYEDSWRNEYRDWRRLVCNVPHTVTSSLRLPLQLAAEAQSRVPKHLRRRRALPPLRFELTHDLLFDIVVEDGVERTSAVASSWDAGAIPITTR